MGRRSIERKLNQVSARLRSLRGELSVIDEQLAHLADEADDMALRALFPPALGFECVEAAMQNPIVGRFSWLATPYLRLKPVPGLYCHSNFIGRKVRDVERIDWRTLDVGEVVAETRYPPPQA